MYIIYIYIYYICMCTFFYYLYMFFWNFLLLCSSIFQYLLFLSVSTTIIKSHQEFVECLIIFLSKCFTIINVEFCQNCYYQSVADRRRKACNLIIKLSNFNIITIYFWNHKHKVYINSLNFKWIMRISVLSAMLRALQLEYFDVVWSSWKCSHE